MSSISFVERLAAIADDIADDRDSRAFADCLACIAALWQCDFATADEMAERAMPVFWEPQHLGSVARWWDLRGWVCAGRGDVAGARRWLQPAIAEILDAGDNHLYGAWLSLDADLAAAAGEIDEALELARTSLDIALEVSCPSCESSALASGALVAADFGGGRLDALGRALDLAHGIGETVGVVMTADVLAVSIAEQDPDAGARILGANDALREQTGLRMRMPGRAAFVDQRLPGVRATVGGERWDSLVAAGRDLDEHGMVAFARDAASRLAL